MKPTGKRAGAAEGAAPRSRGMAAAIGRSLDIYYRDAARTSRMDRLNALFVPDGGLAFDIGAHVGDRTASFLRLGARVVALEPQPQVFRALRLIHGRQRRAVLEQMAAGEGPGEIEMFLNSGNPTVSTASADLVAAASSAPAWKDEVWDRTVRVPVTTLDRLMARHGVPDFVKIDVEGHELMVLKGLARAVPALSFEVTTLQRDMACACVGRLCQLGPYEFNISLGEDHRLRQSSWTNAPEMCAEILRLPAAANSGDIYARLRA
ncbi:FkbM family methyltransferase [Boseongicola sp. H5]|uniref:FkbM family methyltransferase n=1 Tax=Boseongicola sp. H5 TaxID=2763261 RepID=UPI001D0BBB6D|nr:FkbM family methyltransferase [Boseongicola sp. H5]